MITVFAGGVGASRFLQGLVQVEDPANVTVISNTGDDVDMFGLRVSPDTDIVIYSLAGAINPETGWGLSGDSFAVVDQLQRFGYERWFNLGDKDLAMCIHRTRLVHEGVPMHKIVASPRPRVGPQVHHPADVQRTRRDPDHRPRRRLPFQDTWSAFTPRSKSSA